ncbi:MAG TPA: hypothetical protein VNA89_13285 [Gemmatimonadaceae bacterium]|nr:hypothetical protein [Gemmatimonadaceae bacterium]
MSLESVFEFLFKYRPVVFARGELAFASPWPAAVAFGVLAVALPALATYRRGRGRATSRQRLVLAGLRAAALLVLALCLARPVIAVSEAVPQRNVLGVLVDDSRSMRVADVDGRPRADWVRRQLGGPDSALLAALATRFELRVFRFAGGVERVRDGAALDFDGSRTHLAGALRRVEAELGGAPVAGIVVVSDGADNSADALVEPLASLRARRIPVYTVGLGREAFERDVAVSRVELPRSVLIGSTLLADAVVTHRGYAGERVSLVVEDGGRIVGTQPLTLGDDGEAAPVRVRIPAAAAGVRTLRFRVAPLDGEMMTANNERAATLLVTDRREKILYVEGEPRFELKFIRRAVAADTQLQVVALQRTAEHKFLRLGVDDSLELATGFPARREELFAYRAVILGSVEAGAFTLDQLRMLADFVSERGGGLLVLGGRRALGEGGYRGTPVADLLPFALGEGRDQDADSLFTELKVELTPAGATHPATQVAATLDASAARWRTLPALSSVNRLGAAKPGATVLLRGVATSGGERQPVLAYQRFGRGVVVALPVQDSWLWQMHADVPLEDLTHETFWRQLLRWVVSDVPGQVTAAVGADGVEPGETVTVTADVRDPLFLPVNGARATAIVTTPAGESRELPMEWTIDRDGEYRASFTAAEPGAYELRVRATLGDRTITSEPASVRAGEMGAEYFDAEMRTPLLRRVAEETGGRFYTPATAAALPEDVIYTESGTTVRRQKELWDMPAVFLLLVGLVAAEWGVRRARGLA